MNTPSESVTLISVSYGSGTLESMNTTANPDIGLLDQI